MGPVLDDADKLLCLFLAVAKVSLRNDAGDVKRIGHNVLIFRQKYKTFQLYKFYYRNSIISLLPLMRRIYILRKNHNPQEACKLWLSSM